MSAVKFIVVGAGLILLGSALLSGGAIAFQEQQGAATPAPAAAAGEPADKPVQLSPAEVSGSTLGTEVRIPGLGKLGNLPKMDFGLELLYGAADQKQQLEPAQRDDNRDDLTIRGSVKHKF